MSCVLLSETGSLNFVLLALLALHLYNCCAMRCLGARFGVRTYWDAAMYICRVKSGHCCRMSKYITYNVLWATGQVRPVTVPADVSQISVLDCFNPA